MALDNLVKHSNMTSDTTPLCECANARAILTEAADILRDNS